MKRNTGAWWCGHSCCSIKKQALLDLHAGLKKTLVRPDIDPILRGILAGHVLALFSGEKYRWPFLVLAVRRYTTLDALIATEDLDAIYHGDAVNTDVYLRNVHSAYLDKPMLAIDLKLISKQEARKAKRG